MAGVGYSVLYPSFRSGCPPSLPCCNCSRASLRGLNRPGRGNLRNYPPCVHVKERVELYLHSLALSYGMSQSVLHCTLNLIICVRLSHLKPFCSSQNRQLTSLLVASDSYHNCTGKPLKCHVIFQRYDQ